VTAPNKIAPRYGPVQPYFKITLPDNLVRDLRCYLECSDADMERATAEIEYRLSMYDAERVSLDQAPSMASIKAEVKPIIEAIYGLLDRLETLTPATLGSINEKRTGSFKDTINVDEGILFIARFGETFKPIMYDKTNSQGGHNKLDARRILIISLADIYKNFVKLPITGSADFISEILEWRKIDVSDKEIAKHI